MAIQPDGRIVAAGTSAGYYRFTLNRFLADGTLDSSFGAAGKVWSGTLCPGGFDQPAAARLQSDGKLVVAGTCYADWRFVIARYTAAGALDTTFAGTGYASTIVPGGNAVASALQLQGDGKLVVSGASGAGDVALARYTAAGALDPAFGTAGIVTTDLGGAGDSALALVLAPDGRLTALGTGGASGTLASVRYLGTGALDTTYGASGISVSAVAGAVRGAVLAADGAIVAAGSSGANFVVQRAASSTVADFGAGTTDWSTGASAFGACLRSVTGSGAAGAWSPAGTCSVGGVGWNAVPATTSSAARIASSTTAGTTAASAHLRFGVRTATNQPPGTYVAPVAFDVVAPLV